MFTILIQDGVHPLSRLLTDPENDTYLLDSETYRFEHMSKEFYNGHNRLTSWNALDGVAFIASPVSVNEGAFNINHLYPNAIPTHRFSTFDSCTISTKIGTVGRDSPIPAPSSRQAIFISPAVIHDLANGIDSIATNNFYADVKTYFSNRLDYSALNSLYIVPLYGIPTSNPVRMLEYGKPSADFIALLNNQYFMTYGGTVTIAVPSGLDEHVFIVSGNIHYPVIENEDSEGINFINKEEIHSYSQHIESVLERVHAIVRRKHQLVYRVSLYTTHDAAFVNDVSSWFGLKEIANKMSKTTLDNLINSELNHLTTYARDNHL